MRCSNISACFALIASQMKPGRSNVRSSVRSHGNFAGYRRASFKTRQKSRRLAVSSLLLVTRRWPWFALNTFNSWKPSSNNQPVISPTLSSFGTWSLYSCATTSCPPEDLILFLRWHHPVNPFFLVTVNLLIVMNRTRLRDSARQCQRRWHGDALQEERKKELSIHNNVYL